MPIKNSGTSPSTTSREKKSPPSAKAKPDPVFTDLTDSPSEPSSTETAGKKTGWTFLTNHSHVIILLANQPDMVLREVASEIGITERAVQRIIADLEEDGFLIREKIGRQNHYRVVRNLPLRHPIEAHKFIGDLVDLILLHKK